MPTGTFGGPTADLSFGAKFRAEEAMQKSQEELLKVMQSVNENTAKTADGMSTRGYQGGR